MAYLCHADRRGRRGKDALRRARRRPVTTMCLAARGLLGAACASLPPPDPSSAEPRRFGLEHDAFAFANLVRARRPGWNDEFANYCLVMAQAASQFYRFARFTPDRPAVSLAEYARRTRRPGPPSIEEPRGRDARARRGRSARPLACPSV